jgi:thiol-disulfide isomerase/thioredoxin
MPIVMNFWATWCKPCVQELPYFEELNKNYSASGLKVVMVSLDFKRELESRLKPFVQKNNMASEVLLLNEHDYNSWINKVDSSWSGAIPATVIISKGNKIFFA